MATFASLYGGFGGVDMGAQAAGLKIEWSIEQDAAIAEVAHANLGHRVYVRNILECDPMEFDTVDCLHASPPCTNASAANANAGETELDIALACKTAAFVTTLKPTIFTLENVWGYRNFKSWRIIEDALWLAGYWLSVEHVNSADYGVPQTRKRMIVRAVRGGFVPYLPEPLPWTGWYAAVADLVDTLPETQFAPWQLARLPELLRTVLVPQGGDQNYDLPVQTVDKPAFTITANHNMLGVKAFLVGDQERQLAVAGDPAFTVRAGEHGGAMPRAFLMAGGGNTNFEDAYPGKGCRYADEPAITVTATSKEGGAMPKAWLIGGDNTSNGTTMRTDTEPALTVTTGGPKHPTRSPLSSGKVVSMTPRCLARFQSFPDSFVLPDNARLAAKGIGNAVPPLMYQRIIDPLAEML